MAWDAPRTPVFGSVKDEFELRVPESYHRARRNVALLGALLIFWKVVEISVDSIEPGGVGISFGAGERIPVVVLVFLAYSGFRYWVEWDLLDSRLTSRRWPVVDFCLTWVILTLGVLAFSWPWVTAGVAFVLGAFAWLVNRLSSPIFRVNGGWFLSGPIPDWLLAALGATAWAVASWQSARLLLARHQAERRADLTRRAAEAQADYNAARVDYNIVSGNLAERGDAGPSDELLLRSLRDIRDQLRARRDRLFALLEEEPPNDGADPGDTADKGTKNQEGDP